MAEANYVVVEDSYIYMYQLKNRQKEFTFFKNELYIFSGYIKNINNELDIIYEYEFTANNETILNQTSTFLLLDCNVNQNEIEYYKYDQSIVDLIYTWDNETEILKFKKKTWTYLFATLLYSGVPITLPDNTEILIDGSNIETVYEFFIVFSENFLGRKKYFANNQDSLIDTLKNANTTFNNKIIVKNRSILKHNLANFSGDMNYLEKILTIFENYNFIIEFSK
ncbi:barstar family protein [Flavobacterium sp. H122]|uniref:barstar family protein n=1 Tax=Flavobacterium sp. H122 TaxID=2529860 RepID=UPI00145B7D40|nr:barstar family protein [Flavobacterium sp. H122]